MLLEIQQRGQAQREQVQAHMGVDDDEISR
jgi:hypothetical protein